MLNPSIHKKIRCCLRVVLSIRKCVYSQYSVNQIAVTIISGNAEPLMVCKTHCSYSLPAALEAERARAQAMKMGVSIVPIELALGVTSNSEQKLRYSLVIFDTQITFKFRCCS